LRLTIAAVGRLKGGPEADLIADYLGRADAAGRGLAIGPATVTEIDERKARTPDQQAERLLASVPASGQAWALDERGEALTSRAFARRLAEHRDRGCSELVFLIGGADGHGAAVRAGPCLSLGPMVWPHMLARVMLAEQIWRAVSILAGGPYHRD